MRVPLSPVGPLLAPFQAGAQLGSTLSPPLRRQGVQSLTREGTPMSFCAPAC